MKSLVRPRVSAKVEALVTAIANSSIKVRPVSVASGELLWSNWENVRHLPDVDAVVLAWIASHVRPRRPASLI